MNDERLLTVPEVMERLRLGRSKVYDLIRSHRLTSIKVDGCRRIPSSAVTAFISVCLEEEAA